MCRSQLVWCQTRDLKIPVLCRVRHRDRAHIGLINCLMSQINHFTILIVTNISASEPHIVLAEIINAGCSDGAARRAYSEGLWHLHDIKGMRWKT